MSENSKTTVQTIEEEPKMVSKKEQIGHAIGVLGHDSSYTLWSTWMSAFLTDIVQMPMAVYGFLMAFGRVFDGINDIMMGSIADRTRSKLGRFRPWILFAGPAFCICMALSFLVFPGGTVAKCIYACIMYVLVDVVFTAVDIPFWSLPAAMTSNTKERSDIIGTTQTASQAITGIIGFAMPLALAFFGGPSNSSYFKVAAIVAVFGIVMYLISFRTVKEHVVPEDSEKFSLRLGIKSVVTNKPLLCVQICNAVGLLAMIMRGNFNYYYCRYNIGEALGGGDAFLGVMAVKSGISTVAGVVGSILFIILAKKISKRIIMFVLAGGYIAASMVLYFAGWTNLTIIYCCDAVTSTCVGGFMVAVMAMMSDTIEYGEWKTGQRNEGMITSTRCFVTKLVMAVSGVVVAAVMGIFGYEPNAPQSPELQNIFHTLITLVCSGTMVIGIIPMFFYDLTEKRHAEILAELKARKAGKQ